MNGSFSDRLGIVRQKIKEIIATSPIETDPFHSIDTEKWVLQLKPDADEALCLAARCHDIDRAVSRITNSELKKSDYNQYKKEHAIRSASIMKGMLTGLNFNKDFIGKISYLVENHEVGGDADANILCDADSISYFNDGFDKYLERNGLERTKNKVSFMYSRASDRASNIIKSLDYSNPELKKIVEEVE